jgi:hypothetical protein
MNQSWIYRKQEHKHGTEAENQVDVFGDLANPADRPKRNSANTLGKKEDKTQEMLRKKELVARITSKWVTGVCADVSTVDFC